MAPFPHSPFPAAATTLGSMAIIPSSSILTTAVKLPTMQLPGHILQRFCSHVHSSNQGFNAAIKRQSPKTIHQLEGWVDPMRSQHTVARLSSWRSRDMLAKTVLIMWAPCMMQVLRKAQLPYSFQLLNTFSSRVQPAMVPSACLGQHTVMLQALGVAQEMLQQLPLPMLMRLHTAALQAKLVPNSLRPAAMQQGWVSFQSWQVMAWQIPSALP